MMEMMKKMNKKMLSLVMSVVIIGSLSTSSVFAFDDLNSEQQNPITSLQNKGIVSGIDGHHYSPQEKLSYAQAVQMIYKGFMNLNPRTNEKVMHASDYFTKVSNDAWYSNAFLVAKLFGLSMDKDVNPSALITREQFADLLANVVRSEGDFVLNRMVIRINDADSINPDYSGSVNFLVAFGIAKVGDDRNFYPRQEITRGDAGIWIYNALNALEEHKKAPAAQEEVKVTITPVNNEVNKVVLTRAEQPTTGYSIKIDNIRFNDDKTAVITYTLSNPSPDQINGQMITQPSVETYISSAYKPVAQPASQTVGQPAAQPPAQ